MNIEINKNIDVGEIIKLYNKVIVNERSLDISSPESFSNCGGMVSKPSEQEVLDLLNADNSLVILCRDENDVVGFILGTFGLDNNFEDYSGVESTLDENNRGELLEEAMGSNTFYFIDIVVNPDYQKKGVAKLLYQKLSSMLLDRNEKGYFTIVYELINNNTKDKLANRNMQIAVNNGGDIIGLLPEKEVVIGDCSVTILPNLIYCYL